VIVYPDEFYTRFYEAKLAGRLSTVERQRLTQALEDSHKSVYKLFENETPLTPIQVYVDLRYRFQS
jgi:hypothetical protein